MSYTTEVNKFTRTKIDIIILKLDYCGNTYGVSPCTADGEVKCYNTFPTCQDQENYTAVTKEYKFITSTLPVELLNNHNGTYPFIKSVSDIATEIRENDTFVKRLKVPMYDDNIGDFNIDKYADERSAKGTFWKKFVARNRNYKKGTLTWKQGFNDMLEADFKTKFAGRIDNIELGGNGAVIEAVDFLKELSKIEYPVKSTAYIPYRLGQVHTANSEAAMLLLPAVEGDYAKRVDYLFAGFTTSTVTTGGTLTEGNYTIVVIGYDVYGRPIERHSVVVTIGIGDGGDKQIDLEWTDISSGTVSYWYCFWRISAFAPFEMSAQLSATPREYSILSNTGDTQGEYPNEAERYFVLDGDDPTEITDWDAVTAQYLSIYILYATDFDSTGWIKIEDEMFQYFNKTTIFGDLVKFDGIRGSLNTEPVFHPTGTVVHQLFGSTAGNPFTFLKDMLTTALVDAAYISDKFDEYESAWTGPDVSLKPSAKTTKLNKIFFDLVNLVDCMCFVNEEGKVDILDHEEDPESFVAVTDEANIILGSAKVNLNEAGRKTRWLLYWDKHDPESDEPSAYNNVNITVDVDAEELEYDGKLEDVQFTSWFNSDSDDFSTIDTYINALLVKRKNRTRNAPAILECDQEIKDAEILVGQVVKITTDELQDIHGDDYTAVEFRVVKKEEKDNKISFKYKRRF